MPTEHVRVHVSKSIYKFARRITSLFTALRISRAIYKLAHAFACVQFILQMCTALCM